MHDNNETGNRGQRMQRENHASIPQLTEAQIDEIAERAAAVALERVYTQIGKSVVSKFLWLVGAGTLAVAAWLNGAGYLHK